MAIPIDYRRDCPAPRHDTQTAAEVAGCVCPTALEKLAQRNQQKNVTAAARRRGRGGGGVTGVYHKLPDFTPEPPMRRYVAVDAQLEVQAHAKEHGVPCQEHDPELWFPISEDGPEVREQIEASKNLCGTCPVRNPCAAWAMASQPYGTWGGLTEWDRERLKRVRRPGTRRAS